MQTVTGAYIRRESSEPDPPMEVAHATCCLSVPRKARETPQIGPRLSREELQYEERDAMQCVSDLTSFSYILSGNMYATIAFGFGWYIQNR